MISFGLLLLPKRKKTTTLSAHCDHCDTRRRFEGEYTLTKRPRCVDCGMPLSLRNIESIK